MKQEQLENILAVRQIRDNFEWFAERVLGKASFKEIKPLLPQLRKDFLARATASAVHAIATQGQFKDPSVIFVDTLEARGI